VIGVSTCFEWFEVGEEFLGLEADDFDATVGGGADKAVLVLVELEGLDFTERDLEKGGRRKKLLQWWNRCFAS
jgi:hypothetical protein